MAAHAYQNDEHLLDLQIQLLVPAFAGALRTAQGSPRNAHPIIECHSSLELLMLRADLSSVDARRLAIDDVRLHYLL